MKISKEIIKAHALKNALAHNGKAQQGAVISGLFSEGLDKKDVKKYINDIKEIVDSINKLSLDNQLNEFGKLKDAIHKRKVRVGLPELPNAKKGKVIMRFAPSASGGLHVGHAITASLSYLYVKKYGGKFYVRIEDTNPENIYKPAYKMIEQESNWLFKKTAKIVIQSNRMKTYYKYVEKLIDKNKVYVCICSSETFKGYSERKQNCPCRNLSVKDNRERWKKMLNKTGYKVGEAVLRFKSSKGMKNPNPAMRDFPLARINTTPHPKQNKKYKVWPLMNLAVAVDDLEMKMTHIIRGKDHRDNALRQEMIHKSLGEKSPWTAFIGRTKFKDMELSTTKFREDIEKGKYSGWDDKKLPTIASLKKQGYKPQSFWKFAEHIRLSQVDKVIDKKEYFQLLNTFSKK